MVWLRWLPNVIVQAWLVQVLHPPQKFETSQFKNGWKYIIKNYGVEVIFNGVICLLNIMKIYHLIQKLLVEDKQTNRLVKLSGLPFHFESKMG
jgi:hypothetical protein